MGSNLGRKELVMAGNVEKVRTQSELQGSQESQKAEERRKNIPGMGAASEERQSWKMEV